MEQEIEVVFGPTTTECSISVGGKPIPHVIGITLEAYAGTSVPRLEVICWLRGKQRIFRGMFIPDTPQDVLPNG